MTNNVFNAKLPNEQLKKFSNLVEKLNGVENKIPLIAKKTFNFKGRKSAEIAKIIIENLTDSNSYICDPFMGSGSFVDASVSLDRKTLGIELDNYTFSVVKTLWQKANIKKLRQMFSDLKNSIFEEIMELYATSCCNEKNFIKVLYYDPEPSEYYNPQPHREIHNGKNIKLYYKCPKCGNTTKKFEKIDEKQIEYTNSLNTSSFPSHNLIENSRINITASTGANVYDINFTNRNKFALLKIQEKINDFQPCIERDILEHALVSSLTLARIAQYGSGSEYIYQVMRFKAQEMNVWYIFENKIKSIIAYKTHYAMHLQSNDLQNNNNKLTILQGDYSEILNKNEYSEVFDMIYTDPPYTDQVPYLERSQLYRDWLYNFYNENFELSDEMLDNEMVVSNAPTRSNYKNLKNYYKDLDKMFKTFYHCTKPNGIVALTVNLGKYKYFKVFSEIINKARKNGFEYVYRIDLTKKDPSLRKQAAFKNTLSTEMLVFFIKLDKEKAYWYINDKNIEIEIAKLIYKLIMKNNGIPLARAIIEVNKTVLKIENQGRDDTNNRIRHLIEEQFYVDKRTSMVYVNPDKLYLSIEDDTTLFNKLYDVVPILINNLLEKKGAFTLDDLYFDISSKICNGDPNLLSQVLNDPSRIRAIEILIENYCETKENLYVRKTIDYTPNKDAIDIAVLEGNKFEEVLKRLLEAEGYIDVIRIGGAGDRGVDLRAKKKVNGKIEGYIFQAKRWIANVSSQPIQRLHSMMMQYPNEIHHAVCITTSDYTSHGINEAKSTGVQIINGKQLMERLNAAFPGEYYHSLLNFNL